MVDVTPEENIINITVSQAKSNTLVDASNNMAKVYSDEAKKLVEEAKEYIEARGQSDFAEEDETKVTFIKNKPTKLSDFENDEEFTTRSEVIDELENYVPATRTINGQPLTDDVEISTASAVSELTDVELENLQDGQLLGYNSLSQKWENKDIVIPEPESQLTKFSINDGKMTNGVEDILNAPIGTVDVPFVQPTMTENGTLGVSPFAVTSTGNNTQGATYIPNAYKAFNGSSTYLSFNSGETFTIYSEKELSLQYILIDCDYVNNINLYYSDDNVTYTSCGNYYDTNPYRATKKIINNISTRHKYWKLQGSNTLGTADCRWHKISISATYQETQISADTLYFNVSNDNPITYTNCNGETFTKTVLSPIDVTDKADGTYNVMLNSTNQPYLHSGNIYYQKSEPTNTTIVGSPTINNGVVSGFSTSNYLKTKSQPQNKTWELLFKYTTAGTIASTQTLCCNNGVHSFSFHPKYNTTTLLNLSSNGTSWDIGTQYGSLSIQANTTYWFKIAFDGTKYTVDYSTDGISYTNDITITSSSSIYQNNQDFNIGINRLQNGEYIDGSIDLNESYIKVDNQIVYRYGLLPNDIWLNKNNQKAYKYVADALVEFADVPCGKVTIASGIITNVEQPRFNELRYKYSSVKSNKYVDVIAGASGSPYTAKADGYLWINIRIPTLGNAVYINYEDGSQTLMRAALANSTYSLFSQNIRKGDTVIYGFDSAVAGSVILRFIYAESEV